MAPSRGSAYHQFTGGYDYKRMTGIEPASKAWEAFILPMNYIRKAEKEDNNNGGKYSYISTLFGFFAKFPREIFPTILL